MSRCTEKRKSSPPTVISVKHQAPGEAGVTAPKIFGGRLAGTHQLGGQGDQFIVMTPTIALRVQPRSRI